MLRLERGVRVRRPARTRWARKSAIQSRAAVLGVGTPEAAVVGVVALTVFGPKGLAEVARNVGRTVRAFQPTIRELQRVSRDFRDTLEQELEPDNEAFSDNVSSLRSSASRADRDGSGVDESMRRKSEELAWEHSDGRLSSVDAVEQSVQSSGKGKDAVAAATAGAGAAAASSDDVEEEGVTEAMKRQPEKAAWDASEERAVTPQVSAEASSGDSESEGESDEFGVPPLASGPDERLTRPPPSEEEVLQQNAPSSSLPDLAELDRLEQYKEGNFEETTAASNQIDVRTSTGSENGGIGT